MKVEEIIDEFRYFGGVFENLQFEFSENFGIRLVVIDPSKKFKIFIPENLLYDIDMIELNEQNQIIINNKYPCSVRKRKFFENYQQYLGWGNSGYENTLNTQSELQKLPNELMECLLIFGLRNDFKKDLSPQFCLQKYFLNRKISHNGKSKIMPIMELLNHSDHGHPFLIDAGVTCSGYSDTEAYARYHYMIDGFDFFQIYNFAIKPKVALSCDVSLTIPTFGKISINRTKLNTPVTNSLLKKRFIKDRETKFYDIELANTLDPHMPINKFEELCQKHDINKEISQSIFKGLLKHNIITLNHCLELTANKNSNLIFEIDSIFRNQLKIIQDQYKFYNF